MKAVALDFGASSARYAIGICLADGVGGARTASRQAEPGIEFEVVEQIPHEPLQRQGRDVWNFDLLLEFCRRALDFARREGAVSLGIDTWGVDHGFVDRHGKLILTPVCYRDRSHQAMFDRMAEHRPWLYRQTGIQHQPFNTLYQLLARKEDDPELMRRVAAGEAEWLLLPDLLLYILGAERGCERSIASTTQLTGRDGNWNPEVFQRFDLPMPSRPIGGAGPGGEADGVRLLRIAGHDTACAVRGMGLPDPEDPDAVFVNVGTWALVGKVCDDTDFGPQNEAIQITHERTSDNRIRLLWNIPGFFILSRLHADLGIGESFADWLAAADPRVPDRLDTYDPALFAPESMPAAVARQLGRSDYSTAEWAGLGLASLADAIEQRVRLLGGRTIRLGGGGSNCAPLVRLLADRFEVRPAPAEATLVGNLAQQFDLLR